jgi:Cu(I)/Ag(I) efflux system membrane fusion protein
MRNSYIVSIMSGILVTLLAVACNRQQVKEAPAVHKDELPDSSITRLAKPVNAQVVATIPVMTPAGGARIYSSIVNGVVTYDTRNQTSIASRVGGRIEKLWIKYNYQPVKKGQLIMEVYAPNLAAAQRELLYVAGSSPELLAGARQRLQLLGMPPGLITQVLKTGNILYRIPVYSNSDGYILEKSAVATASSSAPATSAAGDGMGSMGGASATVVATPAAPTATPVLLREGQYVSAGQPLFTIYQNRNLVAEFSFPPALAATIKTGQPLLFYPAADRLAMQTGKIGLIVPVFRNGENFTLARVYLPDNHLRTGQLLTAHMPVLYKEGWWLPKQAVAHLGNQSLVFKKKGGVYVPVAVVTGVEAEGMIQVMTPIGNCQVAVNASYLVDSESFIKMNDHPQQ